LQINRLSKSARGDFGSASVETKSLFEVVQNVLYQIRRADDAESGKVSGPFSRMIAQ